MRYWIELENERDKLNLYTIWAMMAYAHEINKQYPISKDSWFLAHQVKSLQQCIDLASDVLRVTDISIDQYTVDVVLDGLAYEAMLCRADCDVTCYSLEYSMAAEFLRDKLVEKFKC